MTKPAMPAARPWLSAWRPSVADTCELEMSSSWTGSAPVLRMFASSWAEPDREAALDLRAVAPVDALGVLAEVDRRRRDELVVEHDREVLVDLVGRLAGQDADARAAALGDLAS